MTCESPFNYTTPDSVKVRIGSKVQFQKDEYPRPEEISNELFIQMVRDAESDVELALLSRYYVPFQPRDGGPFTALPDHTIRQIRKVVDQRAEILIMSTDFGRGTHVSATPYLEAIEKLYEDAISALLGKEKNSQTNESYRTRMSPPLPGLRLALTNVADTGIFGKMINGDGSHDSATYAEHQINDPSRAYIRGPRGGEFP